MQGLTFGMEGPNMEGTWYNPHTGDSFTVRNSFFEDNQFIVQTEDGRILKYEQIQEYIKSDKPINIQTPVQAETLPVEVTNILESSYDSNILADDLAMISGNSLGNLHIPMPPTQPEPQGHPEPSFSNYTIVDKALSKRSLPQIQIGIMWNDCPYEEMNMLKNLMDVTDVDIVTWYLDQIDVETTTNMIKGVIKDFLIPKETIEEEPAPEPWSEPTPVKGTKAKNKKETKPKKVKKEKK